MSLAVSARSRHARRGHAAREDFVRHALMWLALGRLDPQDQLGPWTRGLTPADIRDREQSVLDANRTALVGVYICLVAAAVAVALAAVMGPLWFTSCVVITEVAAVLVWRIAVAGRRFNWMVEHLEVEVHRLPVDNEMTDVLLVLHGDLAGELLAMDSKQGKEKSK